MIYERIEVVDSDERVGNLEKELEKTNQGMITLSSLYKELFEIQKNSMEKDHQIKELEMILENK